MAYTTCCVLVNLDIFLKIGLFGCSNSIIGFYDIILVYLKSMEDVWIFSDYPEGRLFIGNLADVHGSLWHKTSYIKEVYSEKQRYTC